MVTRNVSCPLFCVRCHVPVPPSMPGSGDRKLVPVHRAGPSRERRSRAPSTAEQRLPPRWEVEGGPWPPCGPRLRDMPFGRQVAGASGVTRV